MGSSYQKPVAVSNKDQKPLRVFINGPHSAGKTTVLNVAKFGKDIPTVPTIGAEIVTLAINNISILAIDEGGRSRARVFQRIHYRKASGIILVIDSTDSERITEVRDELLQISNEEELENKPILIFANKQDLSNSMTLDEIQDKLNLTKLNENVKWHLQSACAIRNEGLREGFEWLAHSMGEKLETIKPINETINDLTALKCRLVSMWNMANLKTLWSKFVQFS
ncbi:unnamed protein product [Rotaria sp. Silwood2]|nr:unnamed protein product [Rotaria sp. Silwood2]CAF4285020.1 unnamed protein product [Rotaria sp. Silwood2]